MSEQTAVTVRGISSIVGTLDEKTRAFQQIGAAAASGLFPAGYEKVEKIIAACWFADGLGIHPTVYMEGIQPVQFGGKTVREPKWEFINALLRSRLPGFDYEVHEESDSACEITFVAAGRKPQRVRYDMAEAVRQGLAGPNGRSKDTYEKNARKMLWKQCFKMGADRIGADALAGLPPMSYEIDGDVPVTPVPTTAQVIEEVIQSAKEPALAEEVGSATVGSRTKLAELITKKHGKLSKAVMAERVTELYNAMILARTGANPNKKFRSAADLGPAEADQLVAYLEEMAVAQAAAEEIPPAETFVLPEAPPTIHAIYSALMETVDRARKIFGRQFIQEHKPNSGTFWFIDAATFSQLGYEVPVKVQVNGEVVLAPEKIEQLTQVLALMCDEKERGGR